MAQAELREADVIVTISAVEPFGDYGVGINWSTDSGFAVIFGAEMAAGEVRMAISGPDDRLQVRGESANPVFVETLNRLLGTAYEPWKKVPDGFFSAADLVPA